MNEIRPDSHRRVDASETGLTKKTASGKTLGTFPKFLRFQKQQKQPPQKVWRSFSSQPETLQTWWFPLPNSTNQYNPHQESSPNGCRTKKHRLRSHGFHVRGWWAADAWLDADPQPCSCCAAARGELMDRVGCFMTVFYRELLIMHWNVWYTAPVLFDHVFLYAHFNICDICSWFRSKNVWIISLHRHLLSISLLNRHCFPVAGDGSGGRPGDKHKILESFGVIVFVWLKNNWWSIGCGGAFVRCFFECQNGEEQDFLAFSYSILKQDGLKHEETNPKLSW